MIDLIPRETPLRDAIPETLLRAWIAERKSLPLRTLPGMEESRWAGYHIHEICELHANEHSMTFFAPQVPCLIIARYLAWDATVLGISSMSIEHFMFSESAGPAAALDVLETVCDLWREEGHDMALHKASPANLGVIAAMGHAGFEMLSVHLDYLADAATVASHFTPHDGYEYGPARPDEEEAVARLTSTNYALMDRFNIDPLIPRDKVPQFYWEWGRNAFHGYSDLVWVARYEGQVAGITFWKHRPELEAITGVNCELNQLGAVDSRYWNQGVFRRMTSSVLAHLRDAGALRGAIATNILNHSLQRSVQNIGCVIHDSVITYRKDLKN
ncbi:MAG: hypothetical protein SGI88_13045 [Candidatus Hydrogenedentes bacterium]|nr:hypothetical protein [Candidatus Hydrogenedentota bacterium]